MHFDSKPIDNKFLILFTVFIACICSINFLGSKIVQGFGLTFGVAALFYAITFPCTDVIAEVYGKSVARTSALLGIVGYLVVFSMLFIALKYPPAEFWQTQNENYISVLAQSQRLMLASVVAFFVSQLHDVWAFHFWKTKTGISKLWLRNNLSTISSQFIDSIIFVSIGFYGLVEQSVFLEMMFGVFLIKVVIAVIDTPVVYALVKWARR